MAAPAAAATGRWVDVAHVSRNKLILRGSLLALLAAVLGLAMVVAGRDVIAQRSLELGPVFALAIGLVLTWYVLGLAILRFMVVARGGCYFQAGPEGIRFRGANDEFSAMFLRFRLAEAQLSWSQIQRWYPYTFRVSGIPAFRQLMFETRTEKHVLDLYPFQEGPQQILDNVQAASR